MQKKLNLNGEFFEMKKGEYNDETLKSIIYATSKLEEIEDRPLMMLGKIQSGKTRSFIGVTALAFDNGYDLSIILTKNSNALAMQTVSRMKEEFKEAREEELVQIYDIMCMPEKMSGYELEEKLIIVVKKEKNNIPKMLKFIEDYSLNEDKKCLIIDDEADFCSVGYDKNRETEDFDLRKIASQINELRLNLTCKFIQVTATPYSLYLQPESINLSNREIVPIKPADTVLVPYGKGYIGGEEYFDREKYKLGEHLFIPIDKNELGILKSSDRRKFKEEEALTSNKIQGLRSSIINFIVGGSIRILQNGGKIRGKHNKFSFIIHTEIAKAAHVRQENIVSEVVVKLTEEAKKSSELLEEYVKESYRELSNSVEAYGYEMPTVNEVFEMVKKVLKNDYLTYTVVNSEKDINTLLDETGQLKLRTPFNIFIGGQILDRGITIANLIGFYYGRSPQKMQQDTVLQHSRMYGYRGREDLAVTRFYTTLDLYERMKKIHEFDTKLREDFEEGNFKNGVIFISKDTNGKVIPCSPQKIKISNTQILKPGKTVLPVGFQTGYKTNINSYVKEIDDILKDNNEELKGEYKITRDNAIKIIELIYKTIEIESETCIDKEGFVSLLKYLAEEDVAVYCRTGRNVNRLRNTSRYYADMPYSASEDLKKAREMANTKPCLMLLKQNGREEDNWKGAEFYWPILVIQSKLDTVVYTSEILG